MTSDTSTRLPQKVNIDMSMEEFEESLKPIPDGTDVEVRLKSIQGPGENASDKAPDQVVFEVHSNPDSELNGKVLFYPLFTGNRKTLIRVADGAFGWTEDGRYFDSCLDISLFGTVGIREYTPEGASEAVQQNTLKLR